MRETEVKVIVEETEKDFIDFIGGGLNQKGEYAVVVHNITIEKMEKLHHTLGGIIQMKKAEIGIRKKERARI